jgi:hypothetical protein
MDYVLYITSFTSFIINIVVIVITIITSFLISSIRIVFGNQHHLDESLISH